MAAGRGRADHPRAAAGFVLERHSFSVMAGLDPAIQAAKSREESSARSDNLKGTTWMAGSSPAMTMAWVADAPRHQRVGTGFSPR
jgi:hypothetical protein